MWLAGFSCNMVFLVSVAAVFILFAEPLVGLFTRDPAAAAERTASVSSYGYAFYAWGMGDRAAFNGAGDTTTPTWVNLFCYWLFQVPLAWTLATGRGWGRACSPPSRSRSRSSPWSASSVPRGTWKTHGLVLFPRRAGRLSCPALVADVEARNDRGRRRQEPLDAKPRRLAEKATWQRTGPRHPTARS